MRRFLSILRWALVGLTLLVVSGLAILLLVFPRSAEPPDISIERTPERIDRGRYLVEHVANCLDCHSERDWSYYGGPVVPGTKGMGAPLRVLRPHIQSANITPAALGAWTDGEIVRAFTSGISRNGRVLNPFMPYDTYAQMSEEDVYAVAAFLRTLPSIENDVPLPRESVPIRLLSRILPKPYDPPPTVSPNDSVAYGRYLANIAECSFCHGADFSGGRRFRIPGTDQRWASVNLTPHPKNRVGTWSRENFIGVFKSFSPPGGREIAGTEVNTVMPWYRFAGMTESDLGAIYDYLRTLPPIEPVAEDTVDD